VVGALTTAWGAFRDASAHDATGWEVTAASAEVQPEPAVQLRRRKALLPVVKRPAGRGERSGTRWQP
jgi:hypothetical protein